jgi:hypothetical protein
MPESIRTLLHDIGDDDAGPSRDLAAGARNRARAIGRRRFAAGALGVVTALALAGAGTAGLIDARGAEDVPAGDPTETPSAVEESTDTAEAEDLSTTCGLRPQDWPDMDFEFPVLGESGTAEHLVELPENPIYRLTDSEAGMTSWWIFADGSAEGIDTEGGYEYHLAPDSNRAFAVNRADGCGAAYVENGFDSSIEDMPVFSVEPVHCPIEWSPTSDKVLFTEPVGFPDSKSYMLDFVTGELTELPEELYCGGLWLPDSEHVLVGDTVMRPDGSEAVQLPALVDGEDAWRPTGVSADRGEICVQEDGEAEGDTHAWRCDRYIDAESGEPLELPVSGDGDEHVVFLDEGSMLILVEDAGTKTQYLVDPAGNVVDEQELPAEYAEYVTELISYHPW